jgi:hypothetical protein
MPRGAKGEKRTMSDDIGRELRRFRGFMNRASGDEAKPPPTTRELLKDDRIPTKKSLQWQVWEALLSVLFASTR